MRLKLDCSSSAAEIRIVFCCMQTLDLQVKATGQFESQCRTAPARSQRHPTLQHPGCPHCGVRIGRRQGRGHGIEQADGSKQTGRRRIDELDAGPTAALVWAVWPRGIIDNGAVSGDAHRGGRRYADGSLSPRTWLSELIYEQSAWINVQIARTRIGFGFSSP